MPSNKDRGVPDLAERVSLLKRAGLPTAVVVLVTVMSIPGVWEFFFDRTDDEAKVKAEVAYQLLKEHTEAMMRRNDQQDVEIGKLRETINAILLQRASTGIRVMRAPQEFQGPAPLPETLDLAAGAAIAKKNQQTVGHPKYGKPI